MKDMPSHLFFSIVVPAHNEAKYIENTLQHLQAQEYSADAFEVIVVENGSTDGTFELARRFESNIIRVLQSEKGVSKARNRGIDAARADADWFVFLDADTVLGTSFLRELNNFLSKRNKKYTVGTVEIMPEPDSRHARAWMAVYNLSHRATKSSCSIFMAKRSCFPPVRFPEDMIMGEDLEVIARLCKLGSFFFMKTRAVRVSTRRFEQLGWWHVFFSWTFVAMLPRRVQKRFDYKVVR